MTDAIRLEDDQLQKIMAAILTAGGKYDHEKQVVDEVKRLCDAVDAAVPVYARVGGRVKFLPGHWAVEEKSVEPGTILRIVKTEVNGYFWTEGVKEYPAGICFEHYSDNLEFLP